MVPIPCANRATKLPYAVAAVLLALWFRSRCLLHMGVRNAAGLPYGSRHKASPRIGYKPPSNPVWASQPISLLKLQTKPHQPPRGHEKA